MDEIKLEVQIRKEIGSQALRGVRRNDFLPGVVYGGKKAPTAVKVDRRAYEKIMRHHRGESVVFHINVMEGAKKLRDYSAIVKEEQHDPVTNSILHIDFNRISLTQELEVKVPIEVKGEAVGVKKDDGILEQILWELEVICLPTNIPQHLEIDVSNLEIGKSVHVNELALPEGVRTKQDPEAIVVTVAAPKKEEEEEVPAEGEEPEVLGEKGEKKEGEEGEAKDEKKDGKAPEKAEDKGEDKGKDKK